MKKFKTKKELRDFIAMEIPILVKPKRKVKYTFVGVFSSNNAKKIVINHLTDVFWNKE